MGSGYACCWRAFVSCVVSAALLAGAVAGAVLVPAGSASAQSAAPVAAGRVPDVELSVGDSARSVAVADFFTGTVSSYSATSADTAVVSVSAAGATITLTPRGGGSARVTVTAVNTAGSATQTFTVKVLPAGCLVALGTLSGSITTKTGDWDRDDGCLSVNRSNNKSERYFAQYYSFTVTEPVEAWFRLSSSQAKRLYLLEGAGTGGRVVDFAAGFDATSAASFWEVLQPGAYTLEATTNDADREADFSLSIDSMAITPPAACVASMGALTAGAVTARSGSWDRDDGCRSVHRTASQYFRYYARYYSFTVTEPLEARFTLSSRQGKRLYLLKGAGAGGKVLDSAGTSSTTAAASFWEVLQPGAYTLEATTNYTAREADFSLSIDSMALNPPKSCVTPLGTLTSGTATTRSGDWDRDDGCRSVHRTTSKYFRYYAQYYSFTVTESSQARFTLSSRQGKYLYLLEGTGSGGKVVDSAGTSSTTAPATFSEVLKPGAYTLEAAIDHPKREADFTLSVALALAAPTKGAAVAARTIPARPVAGQVDVSGAFKGTVESYTATSSDTAVVTTSVNGSVVTLNGVAVGAARVTVTAANAAGSATQSFAVTVRPVAAPQKAATPAAQTVAAGGSAAVDVTSAFSGTVDGYGATSGDTAVVTVSTNGAVVTLRGVAAGTATVTVTATNTGGSATQSLAVTVNAPKPKATGVLAARTVTAGDSVNVDVAGGFSGAVDYYSVTSGNGAVLDIALTGSVVKLTGVAAGTATVTVVGANAAGSATQTMAVTVKLPPPPTLGAQLAARSLQVSETLAVDMAAGFAGQVDSYTVVSGNVRRLAVTVDGSEVSLRGVTKGSTTVTVTAVNAAGRAARSFNVTVTALLAPKTAKTPVAHTIAVGEELTVRIADAFSGIVAKYGATSSDTDVATVSVDGSSITLTGVAVGTATIGLEAANTAGRATANLPVTVKLPDKLTIAVAAPSHCLGSEGTLAPGGGRRGVGAIAVTYAVTGGAGPYTITSPDAPGITHKAPSDAINISCAKRGIDLATVGSDVNVVEAGPRTLTLTATDNTDIAVTTNIRIEVAENAYTTEYDNGRMHERRTYVLGTPKKWVFITLPKGLTLQFTGLSEEHMAHFIDPTTGATITLDWTTGTELHRNVPTITTATIVAQHHARRTSRQSTVIPTIATQFDLLTGSIKGLATPANSLGVFVDSISEIFALHGTWRPYQGLGPHPAGPGKAFPATDGSSAALSKVIANGGTLVVCTTSTNTKFIEHIAIAVEAWNAKTVAHSDQTKGREDNVFDFDETTPACGSTYDIRLLLKAPARDSNGKLSGGIPCGNIKLAAGCAFRALAGDNPPTITGTDIHIATPYLADLRVLIHELGHFLGLGDYGFGCAKLGTDRSVMSYGAGHQYTATITDLRGRCFPLTNTGDPADMISARDIQDLSAIYSPSRRGGVTVSVNSGFTVGHYYLSRGVPPIDVEFRRVDSSRLYAVFTREIGSVGDARYLGRYTREFIDMANAADPGILLSGYNPTGHTDANYDITRSYEFLLVGLTRGDPLRTPAATVGSRHSVYSIGPESWTLGEPAVASIGQPSPRNSKGPTPISSVEGPGALIIIPAQPIRKVEEVAAILGLLWRCVESAGTMRVNAGGDVECVREDTAIVRTRLGSPECESEFEFIPKRQVCLRTYSMRAAVSYTYSCSRGYSVVMFFVTPGVVGHRCEMKKPAVVLTTHACSSGFTPAMIPLGGVICRKTVPASSSTIYLCSRGYSLTPSIVIPGVVGRRCEKQVPALSAKIYVCPVRYSLARIPFGGQYCRKFVAASATYSCLLGYTRNGTTCYRYTYTSLTGIKCPLGYMVSYNGLVFLCRKKETTPAKVTYSCSSGRLSGSRCVFTTTPTTKTTYSCSSGRLSGSRCVFTTTPTTKTTYSCSSGRLSGTRCVLLSTAKVTVIYDCGDAPTGYVLSGRACIKTTMKPPTRAIMYYCDPGFTLSPVKKTCTQTIITKPSVLVVYSCPSVLPDEQPYQLTTTTSATGVNRSCTRTSTVGTETTPSCAATQEGEDPYKLTVTTDSSGHTIYHCTRSASIETDEGAE